MTRRAATGAARRLSVVVNDDGGHYGYDVSSLSWRRLEHGPGPLVTVSA